MELLEQFRQGDVAAFETLFRQFQGEVYGWRMANNLDLRSALAKQGDAPLASTHEVAEMLGVSRQLVSDWLKGNATPTLAAGFKLQAFLKKQRRARYIE